jgi:ATP-binding dynein motor region
MGTLNVVDIHGHRLAEHVQFATRWCWGWQGVVWVKEKEAKNNLKVGRMGTSALLVTVERAMEAGHSVLIENMGESIDAVLGPVITRSTFKKVTCLSVPNVSLLHAPCSILTESMRVVASITVPASALLGVVLPDEFPKLSDWNIP